MKISDFALISLLIKCAVIIIVVFVFKQGKAKTDKNRLRVEEMFLKTTHAARAEAAAARREEKKRQEKERILQVIACTLNCNLLFYLH